MYKNVQIVPYSIMKKKNWKQPKYSTTERIIFYIAVFSYSNKKEQLQLNTTT